MTEQELKMWNEFNNAYDAEFKNLPFDSADEEFLFKRGCWWAWQASRKSNAVELPRAEFLTRSTTGDSLWACSVREIKDALEAAGVKYK